MPHPYRQSHLILNHGRRQISPDNLRNIYRYKTGVYVIKKFMRHEYRAYFSFARYGKSFDEVIAAAIVERDWLDRYRRRILDRLQVKIMRASLGPSGRRRRVVRRVDIRRVVAEVKREVDRGDE